MLSQPRAHPSVLLLRLVTVRHPMIMGLTRKCFCSHEEIRRHPRIPTGCVRINYDLDTGYEGAVLMRMVHSRPSDAPRFRRWVTCYPAALHDEIMAEERCRRDFC